MKRVLTHVPGQRPHIWIAKENARTRVLCPLRPGYGHWHRPARAGCNQVDTRCITLPESTMAAPSLWAAQLHGPEILIARQLLHWQCHRWPRSTITGHLLDAASHSMLCLASMMTLAAICSIRRPPKSWLRNRQASSEASESLECRACVYSPTCSW